MIYCVSYGINVYVCMLLVKEMSAVFCVVVGACVLPGNSFAVSSATVLAVYNIPKVLADGSGSPCVAGQECMEPTEPITWNVVVGSLLCILGMFVFKGEVVVAECGGGDGS